MEVRLNPWLPAIILGFLSPFLAIGLFLLYSGPESLIYIGVPAIVIYTVLFPALSGLRYRKPKTKTPKEKP
ncbi:hypothetical protein [Aliiroseovarius sp.]|uniref:hypothetical protein n=1 Tax=Aliiroseovarius sp. TaxID=1872442 RepID=UPI003BAB7A2B